MIRPEVQTTFNELKKKLLARKDMDFLVSAEMIALFSLLTIPEREQLSLESKSLVVYLAEETPLFIRTEEEAVLKAAPPGYALEQLNGINIGAGERPIDTRIIQADICRSSIPNIIMADALNLPFKSESIDYIIALHVIEHLPDPVEAVHHWLDIVKPGGGIGLIVPHWKYTWDARTDEHPSAHRINGTPALFQKLWNERWSTRCSLTHLATYPYKMSFDVILRKFGEFKPFTPVSVPTGRELTVAGKFYHSEI